MKNSFGPRTGALACVKQELAIWRFYHHFGGNYRYGKVISLSKLLCTYKDLFVPRTKSLAYLKSKLAIWRFYRHFGGIYRYWGVDSFLHLFFTIKELKWFNNWGSSLFKAKVC